MKKLNSSGFALVETMVVSVFVMVILSIIYINFYPLMGEYEKRESYDTVDGKYAAFWFKLLIQRGGNVGKIATSEEAFVVFDCTKNVSEKNVELCKTLWDTYQVENIYIIDYKTSRFKEVVSTSTSGYTRGLQDYVEALPTYEKKKSLNNAKYRLIIEYKPKNSSIYNYATIEEKK